MLLLTNPYALYKPDQLVSLSSSSITDIISPIIRPAHDDYTICSKSYDQRRQHQPSTPSIERKCMVGEPRDTYILELG